MDGATVFGGSARAHRTQRSRRAAAAKFEVSGSCVVKLVQRWRAKGTLEPAPEVSTRAASFWSPPGLTAARTSELSMGTTAALPMPAAMHASTVR